ncbi:MAG: Ferrochelatase [Holosporales bacterium]
MKVSIVLLNLGGPDSLENVRPFLFNLFKDKAIIDLPFFIRYPLAFLISTLRTKKAKRIYAKMGGRSPLLKHTQDQADALQNALNAATTDSYKVHICMRYFAPSADHIVKEMEEFKPDSIILLPLYPQYSTTTTKSSLQDIRKYIKKSPHLKHVTIKDVLQYCDHPKFIEAHVALIKETLSSKVDLKNVVILFSAHGIPEDCVIKKNDPYPIQIETSVRSIMEYFPGVNHILCYQSKVGPKKWLSPNTDEEIIKYATSKKTLVVVPIAFVSDHSETLVELDMDYKELAMHHGAKDYIRVPSLNDHPIFIDALKDIALKS